MGVRNLDGLGKDPVERCLNSPGDCQLNHAKHGVGSARAVAEASRVGMTTPVSMRGRVCTTPRLRGLEARRGSDHAGDGTIC